MKLSRIRLIIAFVVLQLLFSTFMLPAPMASAEEVPPVVPAAPLQYRMYLPSIASHGPDGSAATNEDQQFAVLHERLLALLTSRLVVTPEGTLAFSVQATAEEIGDETDAYAKIVQGIEETNQLLRTGQTSLAELGFGGDSTQITAASTSSKIYFTIYRPAQKWTVMLEKRQWWGWEFQYTRYMDYTPFYGLGAGTYRLRITKWNGWETCSPASVYINGWNNAYITCIGG